MLELSVHTIAQLIEFIAYVVHTDPSLQVAADPGPAADGAAGAQRQQKPDDQAPEAGGIAAEGSGELRTSGAVGTPAVFDDIADLLILRVGRLVVAGSFNVLQSDSAVAQAVVGQSAETVPAGVVDGKAYLPQMLAYREQYGV